MTTGSGEGRELHEKFNSACPNCGGGMQVKSLACPDCGLKVEGEIELPKLARLPQEDRELIEVFVLCGGSLKDAGAQLGISYPTVRLRLDRLIERLKALEQQRKSRRDEILESLEKGQISAQDAIKMLNNLKN